MRLTLQAFGHELDITLGPVEVEAESPGYLGAVEGTFLGFAPAPTPDWDTEDQA